MLIDQKGKLFGKINIIDLLAILIIVLIAAGVLFKFVLNDNKGIGNDSLIQYSVSIQDVRNFTADAIKINDAMYDSKTDTYMGKVTAKEVKPFKEFITKTDGTVSMAEKPGRLEVLVTIQVPGVVNNYSYLASGSRDINSQSTVFLQNQLADVQGKVVDVKKVK